MAFIRIRQGQGGCLLEGGGRVVMKLFFCAMMRSLKSVADSFAVYCDEM
jgi:hypothetical protein